MERAAGRYEASGHRGALASAVLVAALCGAGSAAASEPGEYGEVLTSIERPASPEQRPFAFVVDPATPARGALALAYTVGVGSGVSADRPIPVVLQGAGPSHQLAVGYGLTSWLEPLAEVTAASSNGSAVASAVVGMKLRLTAPGSPWRAAIMGGALREGASGAGGAWARAAGSWGAGPILVEANGYVERVFTAGRDAIDYAVMAGASWRIAGSLRAGAEYVGQDLEEAGGGGAEGGARQAVGPSVAVGLDGVGARAPAAVVRVGVLGSF
jgi:hypothetical protein